ncbi:MAG: PP2C family protein-serine/threonine phosphatase [Coraliomargarita sp.]
MSTTPSQEPDDNSLLLKASAKRLFETLMEQTADRIYIKDRKSRFVTVSQTLAEMHGYKDRQDLEGLTDFDLFSNEHAQQAYDDEQEILRTDTPIINKVEKETWPDGSVTWVSSSKAPLHLTSTSSAGIFGISRDVTAEVVAQEQLARSERRLREQNETMLSDYESAHKVQRVMIPGRVPDVKNVNIAHVWKPMTSVGGDIFSFPRNPNNSLLFFLGDVCGHGVAAAFSTVLLKYLTSHEAEVYNNSPTDFLNGVNRELTGQLKSGFVTGMAGHFGARQSDGSRTLHLANCGHPLNLVYRAATNTIESVTLPTALVMGIPGGTASETFELQLNQGDRFFTYTDGILEASDANGEEFTRAGLEDCLLKSAQMPLQESLDHLYNTVQEFTVNKKQQDDITLLGFELI